MTLPTPQGWEVLEAFTQAAPLYADADDLHDVLRTMAKKRWDALRTSVLRKLGELPVEPSFFDPEKEATFYEEKLQKLKYLNRCSAQAQVLHMNPGLAWRLGEVDVFANRGKHPLYLEGGYGSQAPKPK